MKNKAICFFLIITTVLLCSCQNKTEAETKQDELYNYEVTEELFENFEIQHTLTSYKTYKNEQELYDRAELVFIGMPLETFTDGEEHYYNYEKQEIEKDSEEEIFYYCTVREVKVVEMLKGDSTIETVRVADEAIVKQNEGGKQMIIGLPVDSSIAKKNAKYVYYLIPALPEEMDFYFIAYDQGLINIDGLDSKVNQETTRTQEVKEKYSKQFEKYDRSKELLEK